MLPLGVQGSAFSWVCQQKFRFPSVVPASMWLAPSILPQFPLPAAVRSQPAQEPPKEMAQEPQKPEEIKLVQPSPQFDSKGTPMPRQYETGKWGEVEHQRFLEAINRFGNDWGRARAHIATRSSTQIRSHAQKYFCNLRKKAIQKARADPRCRGAVFVVTREYWHNPPATRPPDPRPSSTPILAPAPAPAAFAVPAAPNDRDLKQPACLDTPLESQLTFTSFSTQLHTGKTPSLGQMQMQMPGELNDFAANSLKAATIPNTASSNPTPDIPNQAH